MDIAELSKIIGELILDNDRVGLPGLGTFVSEAAPATFSDKGYTINPPYRRLSFIVECLEDEILAATYAQNEGVEAPVAKAFLTAFIAELKGVLEERKTVTFPGLGRLRCTNKKELFFVPDEDLDIFPDGFGLDSVSLKTHHETDEDVSIAVSDLAEFIKNQSAPEPEVQLEPEPDTEVQNETEPQEEQPKPEVQIAHEPQPVPAPQPTQQPAPQPVQPTQQPVLQEIGNNHRSKWLIWLLCIAGIAILLLAAFFILARVAPDFIDSILYTEEELRIINY